MRLLTLFFLAFSAFAQTTVPTGARVPTTARLSAGKAAASTPITLIDHGSGTVSAPLTLNTSGANFLVALVSIFGTSTTPVDSVGGLGNSWTALTTYGTTENYTIWYCQNPAHTGAGHTFSNAGAYAGFQVMAFSGMLTSGVFDVETGNTSGAGASISPGLLTPTSGHRLVVVGLGGYSQTGAVTNSDGTFTLANKIDYAVGANMAAAAWYAIQTTGTATNPTLGTTGGSQMSTTIASFKGQ